MSIEVPPDNSRLASIDDFTSRYINENPDKSPTEALRAWEQELIAIREETARKLGVEVLDLHRLGSESIEEGLSSGYLSTAA